jgi:hypothetical protein
MALFSEVPSILDKLVKQVDEQRRRIDVMATKVEIYDPQELDGDSVVRVAKLEETVNKLAARNAEHDKAFTFVTNEFYALKKDMDARIAHLERIVIAQMSQHRSPSPLPPPRKRSPSPQHASVLFLHLLGVVFARMITTTIASTVTPIVWFTFRPRLASTRTSGCATNSRNLGRSNLHLSRKRDGHLSFLRRRWARRIVWILLTNGPRNTACV